MAHASGLSAEQLAACMPANGAWHYAAEQDGWCKAHEALRADMSDLSAALAALVAREAAGKQLTAWQARTRCSSGSAGSQP